MYGQRKDYSVYTIEDALIIFEEKGLIQEKESIELIHRLMVQSEKGIRHLMSSYINKKGTECTKRFGFFRRFGNSFGVGFRLSDGFGFLRILTVSLNSKLN